MKGLCPLIVILGPTASGKTAASIELASRVKGEIICADSRTLYRGMDIGTAKPSPAERRGIPHFLLDVINPDESMSAARFKRKAVEAIEDISSRGSVPIMVGGSGLYIDSVLYNFQFPAPPEPALRERLQTLGLEALTAELEKVDLKALGSIDLKNPRRIIRAIETAGAPKVRNPLRVNTLVLGISPDKEVIHERISARARQMLRDGLLDEVRRLGARYGWEHESMRAPAYASFRPVATGESAIEEGLAAFIAADTRLAKKQMTWFRRNTDIVWAANPSEAIRMAEEFVRRQEDSPAGNA